MRLERPFVLGRDHAGGILECLVDVAGLLAAERALAHRGIADVIVKRALAGKRRLRVRPLDPELLGSLDRVPFLVRDHAEETLLPHHLGAGDVLDRAVVDLDRDRAGDCRTDHAAMHHPGHLHVGAEVFLTENFRRHIFARDRPADDLVGARILRLRLARGIKRIARLLVPVELDVEIPPADQLRVGDLFGLVALRLHSALDHRQFVGRHIELGGGHFDQHAARFGGSCAHLHAAALDAGRARGAALVDAGGGVTHDDFDGLERHVELFRHDLSDGDEQALAHVHLAEKG
jgi:hypothetical protein